MEESLDNLIQRANQVYTQTQGGRQEKINALRRSFTSGELNRVANNIPLNIQPGVRGQVSLSYSQDLFRAIEQGSYIDQAPAARPPQAPVAAARPPQAPAAAAVATVDQILGDDILDVLMDDANIQYLECPVCMNNVKSFRFSPCGHMACKSCIREMRSRGDYQCPVCRNQYNSVDRVYFNKYLKYKNKYLQLKKNN